MGVGPSGNVVVVLINPYPWSGRMYLQNIIIIIVYILINFILSMNIVNIIQFLFFYVGSRLVDRLVFSSFT